MMMSMSVGPFCDLNQDVDSKDWRYGAVVALKMDENERECKISLLKVLTDFFFFLVDRCPMYFDDGEDPWTLKENFIRVFDFSGWNSAAVPTSEQLCILLSFAVIFVRP